MLDRATTNRLIVAASFVAGLACRYAVRDQVTGDTDQFLLPWYEFVQSHGLSSLGKTFTNYTPFYSYLLLAVTKLHGMLEPWYLIKTISFVFELGCAAMAARLVALDESRVHARSIAFAAVWLAPTVMFNGAVWGQADSIWTFFILGSVYFICRDQPRLGVIAFAAAFAVKAQAIFLGPFIFALVLRRRIHWAWLAVVPVVYLAIAVPALALGQPLTDILTVYLKQAGTFERLSMNAANLWLFVPNQFYEAGVTVGVAISAAAGFAFSVAVARVKIQFKPEHFVVVAALSLLLMPLVLPKMHDRYFYAFEVMAIVLACMKPRLAAIALAAQLDGVLAYLAYYGFAASWLRVAALGNVWILVELGQYAWRKLKEPSPPDATAFSVMTFVVGLGAFWIISLLIA